MREGEGFQLNISEIANNILTDISQRGWSGTLRWYMDSYKRPDDRGMTWVYTPVDLSVVTFVGTREQARLVADAARKALGYGDG